MANQGDKEKKLGLPVISINDRDNPIPLVRLACSQLCLLAPYNSECQSQENMQAGFIHGLVMPLYKKVRSIPVVDCEEPFAQLEANLKVSAFNIFYTT